MVEPKVLGWSYTKRPTFIHDCEKCTFLFGITLTTPEGLKPIADVYLSCQKGYLIRYSSEGPDYSSGMDLKQIITGYVLHSRSFLKEVNNAKGGKDQQLRVFQIL